jgi:hypothetical protein
MKGKTPGTTLSTTPARNESGAPHCKARSYSDGRASFFFLPETRERPRKQASSLWRIGRVHRDDVDREQQRPEGGGDSEQEDDDTMKRVGGMIADGEAVVFALGDNASIDALNARVKEVGGKDVETFTIDDSNEAISREAANDIPEPSGYPVKPPIA